MRKSTFLTLACALAIVVAGCSRATGTVESASEALGATTLNSIEFSGTGTWYQFGQAPAPSGPWPQFDVSAYTASINYQAPAARIRMTRQQTVDPNRVRPTPVPQNPDQYINGMSAWNLAVPAGSPAGTAAAPAAQPATVEERTMEIWTTPHGFLKAAAANNATSTPIDGGGNTVTFTANGHQYTGRINAQNQVESVSTTIDNPVLGDTPVEFAYSDYRDFSGVMFPGRILRTQGGHPALDITVSSVTANPAVDLPVPEQVSSATPPPVTVVATQVAPGVYYLTGGTHHSLAIEQADHIVVVEGPLNEARSDAVIAKVKETIPSKPIRYVVNTHAHFDHSGGLRTYVDEGATVVTHQANVPFYQQAWAAPHTLNPDRLARSSKTATFEAVSGGRHQLTGTHTIELHEIAGSGHNDGFLMVYLPAEGILFEADAYTPPAANAPPPAAVNPFSVNLNENITRLRLNVRQITPGHGPQAVTMADLRRFITPAPRATN